MHCHRSFVSIFSAMAILMFALLLPSPASAASIVARTVVELTELSDLVVEATVVGQESYLDQTGRIMTRTRLDIARYLKGSGDSEVEVLQIGGTLQGRVMTLHGDLEMEVGQHLVLFLRSAEGALWPTLLGWSAFVVQGEGPAATLRRPGADLALHIEGEDGVLKPVSPGDVPAPATLEALVREIDSAEGTR